MHILFVHKNFPAQFGHIAAYLAKHEKFRCTFLSEKSSGKYAGIERIQYKWKSGAREETNFCCRTFENQVWHSQAVFDALEARPDIQPDLIVGHSGFTSTLFLRELYDCPIIGYFEYFYRTKNSDMDFRHDLPASTLNAKQRARARNAMLLLDLENCDAGYSPTQWQRDQLPQEFHDKVTSIFDGIDLSIWRPDHTPPQSIGGWKIPADKRVITYVSRGMESMRGFDIFMKFAKRVCDERSDVVFVVVGEDRVAYGNDSRFTDGKTFKQWVLSQDDYDLSRILFVGRLPALDLAALFCRTDLHVYLTVPFVLSWSLMNALACGATVLASNTAPVQEVIQHDRNGLLVDFFDVDGMVEHANRVLDDPSKFRNLGMSGIELIREKYSLDRCLPQILNLYGSVKRNE